MSDNGPVVLTNEETLDRIYMNGYEEGVAEAFDLMLEFFENHRQERASWPTSLILIFLDLIKQAKTEDELDALIDGPIRPEEGKHYH